MPTAGLELPYSRVSQAKFWDKTSQGGGGGGGGSNVPFVKR